MSKVKQWAVITGCSSGIGASLAIRLSQMNYHVLAIGRRNHNLLQTKQSSLNPDNINICQADIGKSKDRAQILSFIPKDANNRIKYLIHNAAIGDPDLLENIDLSHWEYSLSVNLTAPLFLTKGFIDRLNENNGRILHLGTGVAFNPQIGTSTYGITKCAFHRLYQQIKVEITENDKYDKVMIGSYSPGVVITEGVNDHIKKAKDLNLPHTQYFDTVFKEKQNVPMNECIDKIIYLLTDTDAETFGKQEWSSKDTLFSKSKL